MSDIGLNFSALDILVVGSIIALPLTTIVLVVLIVGRLRLRRRASRRALRHALNAAIIAAGVLWTVPAGIFLWLWIDEIVEEMRAASRHFTLTAERTIDGIVLPVGSQVTLDGYDRLESVTLPADATIALDGATWRGFIKFIPRLDKDAAEPTRISVGEPAVDTTFDEFPCHAGEPAAFQGSGRLYSCTLANDASAQADIADPERGLTTASFVCAAERYLELQPGAGKQVESCTLAVVAGLQGVSCAAGSEIRIIAANLTSCTLAALRVFDGFEIPAGSVVHLTDTPRRLEHFTLPDITAALPAFGMQLPSHAEVWLCQKQWAADQVMVPNDGYVEIGGVKLTGTLNFDCGLFRFGSLFEDTPIKGQTWKRGRTVSREDLDLPPSDRP